MLSHLSLFVTTWGSRSFENANSIRHSKNTSLLFYFSICCLRLNINIVSQRTNHKFDFFPSECQRLYLTNQSIPLSLTSLPQSLNLQDSLCSCQQNVSRSIHHFVIIPQEGRETYQRLKQLPLRHQFLTTLLSCLLLRTPSLTTLRKNQVICSFEVLQYHIRIIIGFVYLPFCSMF